MIGRRKVLLLSYHFPPMASAGSLRLLSFARYLPEFGWDPVVVTVGDVGFARQDPGLLASLGPDARVLRWLTGLGGGWAVRTRSAGAAVAARGSGELPSRRRGTRWRSAARRLAEAILAFPDHALPWHLAAGWKAGRLMGDEGISVLLASSPPVSALLGGWVACAVGGGRWVVDLRDPWADGTRGDAGTLKFRAGGRIEAAAVRRADRVLANTPRFGEALRNNPRYRKRRIDVLPNGYDHEAVERARAAPRFPDDRGRFVMIHAGALYRGAREPLAILEAMARARETLGADADLRLVLAGYSVYHRDSDLLRRIRDLGLEGRVEFPGFLPHDETLARMAAADLLVLIQGEGFALQVPSKAYEYLALGRPVLAVTPEGATAELVRGCPQGEVVAPGDVAGILRCIERRYREENRSRTYPCPEGVLTRRQLTARLARILDEAADAGRR